MCLSWLISLTALTVGVITVPTHSWGSEPQPRRSCVTKLHSCYVLLPDFKARSSGSRVLCSSMVFLGPTAARGPASLSGAETQNGHSNPSRPCPVGSVRSPVSESRRSASRRPHRCCFLVLPTLSCYISRQSSFGPSAERRLPGVTVAPMAEGTVQPHALLGRRWKPQRRGASV